MRLRARPALGYGFAVTNTLVALLLRLWLDPYFPPGFPFLTFFPAVVLTAFLAGAGPGILAAVLSGMAAWYFFIAPDPDAGVTLPAVVAMVFYAGVVAVDVWLIYLMQRATGRLADAREVTDRLLEQQRLMFQELQHRVANNMTFVSSLLHLQRREVVADPARAVAVLDEASARLNTLSRIHRRLYDPAAVNVPVRQYLQEICSDLLVATNARNIVAIVDAPAVTIDISRLMTLTLLVTEVVTNSLKHAFTGRPGGTITLTLEALDAEHLALTIKDDGWGVPEGAPAQSVGGGLGSRIVQGLAKQLGGELIMQADQGFLTRLTFKAA